MASRVEVLKFLASAFNMVKKGDIKSLEDLFNFARQQFGQVDDKLSKQITDTFEKGKVAAVTEKRTKDIMKRDKEEVEANKQFEETKNLLKEQMDILNNRTKDISKGDPTGEKKEGIVSLTNELKQNLKDLKDLDKQQIDLNNELMDAMMGFKKAAGSKDKTKPFRTPGMDFKKENPGYRTPGGSMYAEGNLRTAMREFLKTEVKEGRLKLGERDMFRITEYSPMTEDDPIDVFRRYYGEAAMEAADAMASKLEKGTSFKNYEEIFRANMPELKIKTQGAGSYDQSIIDAERILQEAKDQEEYAKTLDEFDVTDRKKNAEGGIMSTRAKFKSGKIKLLMFLADKGMNLGTEIRKAVNNIFESGDKKLDADMAVDDMFENLGIDRDAVDQKDVLNAYDEAYKTLSVPPGSRGGPDDIAAPFQSAEDTLKDMVKSEKTKKGKTLDLTELEAKLDEIGKERKIRIEKQRREVEEETGYKPGESPTEIKLEETGYKPGDVITSENFGDTPFAPDTSGLEKARTLTDVKTDKTGNLVSKQLKIMRLAEDIQPGLFENLTDEQINIINKYGDRIDSDLLRTIVLDPDPNNQAAAVATLDEVQTMIDKGMSTEEIMNVLQATPRRKQAEGGLAGILKL